MLALIIIVAAFVLLAKTIHHVHQTKNYQVIRENLFAVFFCVLVVGMVLAGAIASSVSS